MGTEVQSVQFFATHHTVTILFWKWRRFAVVVKLLDSGRQLSLHALPLHATFKLYCFKAEEHYQQQKSAPVVDMNVSFNVTWHKCGFMSIVNDVMTGVSNLVYYAQSTIMVM